MLSSMGTSSGEKGSSITGSTLDVHGYLFVTGSTGKTLNADLHLYGIGTLSESFTVYFQANREFHIMPSGQLHVQSAGSLNNADENRKVINEGNMTVNTRDGGNKVQISPDFINKGSLVVQRGSYVQWHTAVHLNGTVDIEEEAVVYKSTANNPVTIGASAAVRGPGKLSLQAGQITIHAETLNMSVLEITGGNYVQLPSQFTITRLVLSGGVIQLTGNVTITDKMEWKGGRIEGLYTWTVEKQLQLSASRYEHQETKSLTNTQFVVTGNVSIIPSSYGYIRITRGGSSQFLIGRESELKAEGITSFRFQMPVVVHARSRGGVREYSIVC